MFLNKHFRMPLLQRRIVVDRQHKQIESLMFIQRAKPQMCCEVYRAPMTVRRWQDAAIEAAESRQTDEA